MIGGAEAEILGEAMAAEMAGMQASSQQFEAEMKENRDRTKDMYSNVFSSLAKKKEPPLRPDVANIAKLLQQQPLLIPVVQKLLDEKLAAISAAVADILGTPEPKKPVTPAP